MLHTCDEKCIFLGPRDLLTYCGKACVYIMQLQNFWFGNCLDYV